MTTEPKKEPRFPAELAVFVLFATALVLRVAVAGGLSRSVLGAHCVATFVAAVVVSFLPGRRLWLDGMDEIAGDAQRARPAGRVDDGDAALVYRRMVGAEDHARLKDLANNAIDGEAQRVEGESNG